MNQSTDFEVQTLRNEYSTTHHGFLWKKSLILQSHTCHKSGEKKVKNKKVTISFESEKLTFFFVDQDEMLQAHT